MASRGSVVLLLLASFTIFTPQEALADKDEYREEHRNTWRPGYGVVQTHNTPNAEHDHRVNIGFEWRAGINLLKIDRTDDQALGTYEHELRFDYTQFGDQPYCATGPFYVFTDLPTGWYFDDVSSDYAEYSWGMPAWRIVKNYFYAVEFRCDPDPFAPLGASTSDRFNITAQIGHCHESSWSSCGSINVYSDTTNRLIPKRESTTGDGATSDFYETFNWSNGAGDSWENGKDPWTVAYGSLTRKQSSTIARHGSYYAKIEPNGTSGAVLRYDYSPTPAALSTASVYHEIWARCPNYHNSSGCYFKVEVKGLDSSGNQTALHSDTRTIPNDDNWYRIRVSAIGDPPFPTSTETWRFIVRGDSGDLYHIDYNQQWYLLPH